MILILLSLLYINLYSIHRVFQDNIKHRLSFFVVRTIFDYMIIIFVVSLILLALNKLPFLSKPKVTFKRFVILSFPASTGGVLVDRFDKE